MGQLLLDGVPIGVPDRSVTAGGVSYDNTQSGLSATDVQGAVDELKARFYRITGTMATSGTMIDKQINYPSGFTVSNCCIISFGIAVGNNYQYRHYDAGIGRAFARLTNTYIIVSSNYASQTNFELVLMKL